MARELTDTQQTYLGTVTVMTRRIRALEAHLAEMRAAQAAAITSAVDHGVPQTHLQEATGLSKGRISQIATAGQDTPSQHRSELLRQWRQQWEEWPADRIRDLANRPDNA